MQKLNEPSCILFVHGAGGGAWEWNVWQRVFRAHGWLTHATELQPHTDGIAATKLSDYAEQIVTLARSLPRITLVGASLGGLLALMTATHLDPRALVLINPLPPAGVSPRIDVSDYPDVVCWGSQRSLASTQRALPDADDAARLYALRRWRDESGAVLREACAGVQIVAPRCPILVLASENDVSVPPASSRALADACAAEFQLLQGASHVGPLLGRNAHIVAELALSWLERMPRAS